MDCIGLSTPWKDSPIVGGNRLQAASVLIRRSKKAHGIGFRCGRSFNPPRALQNACSTKDRTSKTLYGVLGISENATAKDIKTAYRQLARRFHPDAVSADEKNTVSRMFVEIHDAYATLSDPHDRAEYDRQLGAQMRGQAWRAGGYGDWSGAGQCHSYSYSYSYCKGRTWETDQCW